MNKLELDKYNRLTIEKYDVSRFTEATPVDCIMPGYFGGDDILFVAQNPGLLKTDSDDEYYDAYCDKEYDKMERLYIKALKSTRGTYGTFINDVYGKDWSRISFTNVFKCPFVDNVIPETIPARELKILAKQIELLNPKIIVAVGSIARDALTMCHDSIRDKMLHVQHPSYLRRTGKYVERVISCRDELAALLTKHGITKSI